jgi:hypothetical protein
VGCCEKLPYPRTRIRSSHPYMNNSFKKISRNFKKNLGFWDIKRGFPMYTRLKFGEKIPGNVFAAKKTKKSYV